MIMMMMMIIIIIITIIKHMYSAIESGDTEALSQSDRNIDLSITDSITSSSHVYCHIAFFSIREQIKFRMPI